MKQFLIIESISIILQFVFFIPFFMTWRKDCKKIGRENLAVPLNERFTTWLIFFPIWAIPILWFCK